MSLLIQITKEFVMLIKIILINYVLKQLLFKMISHILEQFIVGQQNKHNTNAYITNNHLMIQ